MELLISVFFSIVCAAIAASKGRSFVGWLIGGFFLSIIGLVIICCLSNLNDEKKRQEATDRERRKLREQLKQEKIKNHSFRRQVNARLKSHDNILGVDTEQAAVIANNDYLIPALPTSPIHIGNPQDDPLWHYELDGVKYGAFSSRVVRELLKNGILDGDTMIWRVGMKDWVPASTIRMFETELL